MTRLNKLSWLLVVLFLFNISAVSAQTKEDLIAGTADITWLGIDFSQTKIIGEKNITNAEIQEKHLPGWNAVFINEMKKYDVAKVTNRAQVKYAVAVTDNANSQVKKDFLSMDPNEYNTLDAAKVEALVKKYDFKGNKGIGLMIFVDGMSKGKEEASGWAAYVNMDKKTVIMSQHVTGKPRGFGKTNYWAGAFLAMLKDCNYKEWK